MSCNNFTHATVGALSTVGANALFGAGAAAALTTLHPVGGALFGLFAGITFTLLDQSTSPFDQAVTSCFDCCISDREWVKTVRLVSAAAAAILLGTALTTALGFSLTLGAGVIMILAISASTVAITALFRCCLQLRN